MAIILTVDDRSPDWQILTAILGTRGHEVVETSDGDEALAMLGEITPDVVISDILMPTVDGCELVDRIRKIPGCAATPVIFYTTQYHEHEAQALAHRCGVFHILTEPSAPQVILEIVDAALGSSPRLPGTAGGAGVDRGNPDLARSPSVGRIDRLEAERERAKAIMKVTERIAAERDPRALLSIVCAEARHLTLAQHAVIGLVVTDEGSARDTLYTCGLDSATTIGMTPPSVGGALLTAVIGERRPVRMQNPQGRPEALGLPADHPPVSSWLSVPIASGSRVYGWLSLRNKLGADAFTDLDERVAMMLGAHAGIAYEHARLVDDLHRRITTLERELRERSARARDEERARLSRTLHDQMGQLLASLKMDVQWLAAQLQRDAGLSRHVTDKVASMLQRLDKSSESVRTLARELRPAVLDTLGLVGAIRWQAEEFERQAGIRCRVDIRVDDITLAPARGAVVFAIVQEALTNVFQHAHGTRATVTVRRSTRSLTVSIADNGRGISDRHLASDGSLGFIGMRERAALVGGRLDVCRRRPVGTLVRLRVPLTASPPPAG